MMIVLAVAVVCAAVVPQALAATNAATHAATHATTHAAPAKDPLPSWTDTAHKRAIIAFVHRVTKTGTPDFVPRSARIATFDNDGTLQCEQPMYVQVQFVADHVKALAPQHPDWATREPFNHLVAGDVKAYMATKVHSMIVLATADSGMTTDQTDKAVEDWLRTARHPKTGRPYTEMVYQPMLELLAYLRANGFKAFVVTGSGADFIRTYSEKVYGIPPEQVVGSQGKLSYAERDGTPEVVNVPGEPFIDDGPGKPIGIESSIGRRPILAFGNSDGDRQMLEWTTAGPGPRLALIVHHDDATREWAYDRESSIGHLDKALDEATAKGWTVVSMKDDWKTVFPK
jgi:hypothetical protein